MKEFKGNKIVILLFAAVIIALAVFAILKSRSSDNKKTEIVSKTTTEAVEVSDDIVIKDNPTEKVENTEKMSKKVIKPEEPTTKKKSTGNKVQKVNTEKPAAPVTRGIRQVYRRVRIMKLSTTAMMM